MSIFQAQDIRDCCQRVLDTIVSLADQGNPDGVPGVAVLPTRQIIAAGGLTYDCAMVGVSAMTVQTGFPESTTQRIGGAGNLTFPEGNTIWTLSVEVAVVRCAQERYDGNNPPPPNWIAADLEGVSADAALLVELADRLVRTMRVPIPHNVRFAQPEGQLITTQATLTVPLFEW